MPRGGFRANSGRPRKPDKYGGQIAAAEARIADRLCNLVDRAFELADGVTVQEETGDGGVRVYTRPPDYRAIAYLADRIMGRPVERFEHSGEGGGAIEVTATVHSVGSEELVAWRKERFEAYREEPTNGISGSP
jgi:hypothetical protein